MQFKSIVREEHLNQHGVLFGGYMLHWVDEYSYIAASEIYPSARFATRALEAPEFKRGVKSGSILTFDITPVRIGTTSITLRVDVSSRAPQEMQAHPVFGTAITFCAIDENGNKTPLPERREK